jgi:predicted N-formylglutamate amidohydrolase
MLVEKPAISTIMKTTVLFISCEHAVNTVPEPYRHLFNKQESVLQTPRAIDFGALEIAIHLSNVFSCEYNVATVTRLLLDCNRSLSNTHCFSEFTQGLLQGEKQTLIDKYYLPYRTKTEALIQKHIDRGHQVLHISSHSFTPVFNGITRNAGICLLYDPARHGEKEVAREWRGLLTQYTPPYRVRMNYPYRGISDGFTSTLRKKHPEKDYLGLELEINQTLVEDKESFPKLINVLSESLRDLLQLL